VVKQGLSEAGVYSIVDHGSETRLVYKLEIPSEPGDVQEEFKISEMGNYIISVKVSISQAAIDTPNSSPQSF
jgi:hypothetical protein